MSAPHRAVTPRDASVAEVGAMLRDLRGGVIVATHHNPDGDAIGSLLAMGRALRRAGRDVVLWHPDPSGVPDDLAFLLAPDEEVVRHLPDDHGRRTLVALDCATEGRLSDGRPAGDLAATVVNIDHHHDNGRYGDVNLVAPSASSTAELLVAVLDAAGWEIDRPLAEPLHVGIVTDTGRFSYSNTSAETLRTDARLVATGIDVAAIARALYENLPLAQARLLGAAMRRVRSLLDGRLIVAVLTAEDFDEAGTDDADGIAELLRGIRGAEVGALVRPVAHGLRASLRAASDRVDVSAIARRESGGGHPAAAGVTSQRSPEDFVRWLAEAVAAQLDG